MKKIKSINLKKLKKTIFKFPYKFKIISSSKDIFIKKLKTIEFLKFDKKNLKPYLVINKLQDKIEDLVKNDSNQVFLQQSQFWAKAITWVLMGSTAFAIGWVAIAETDEVVIAAGKLEPKGGVFDVQMPLEGIAKEILVKDGQKVIKGQILIRLDTEISTATNNSLQKNLALNTEILNRLEKLAEQGAVPEVQYMQQKEKIIDIDNQIATNLVRMKYQEIKSPVDGIVFELLPKGPGFVAQTSQPVMKIVPFNNLLAKVEIDSRTIGFVKQGKHVDISIDSFPASDFGVIKGKVSRIGSDALIPIPSQGKGYRFPAEITLNNQYLELKSGQKLPLQAGMSLTANIKLRKVTYLKLLLNKFGDKADSLKSI
jgi:hemolysin D